MIRRVQPYGSIPLARKIGLSQISDRLFNSGVKIMSIDDESLLGAYLDGELEPEQRLVIESSLATDAQLAETVHALASVRDLLASLPRPSSADVSPEVMGRIRQDSLHRRLWSTNRIRRWGVVAGLAASVLVVIVLRPFRRPGGPGAIESPAVARPVHSTPSPTGDSSRPELRPDIAAIPSYSAVLPDQVFEPTDSPGMILASRSRPATTHSDQERVRNLLDDPRLRRVFLVADHLGQPSEQEVASLVERTTHRDYFKITVAQGIVIDPAHPGKATVFAVVLDENELGPFRNRLREAFSDRLEEQEVNPVVAMQLADIGQVVALPANPIGDLMIPGSNMAFRAPDGGEPKNLEPGILTPDAERDEPAAQQKTRSSTAGREPSGEFKQTPGPAGLAQAGKAAHKESGVHSDVSTASDDQLASVGTSHNLRHSTVRGPTQSSTARGMLLPSRRPLVVLVWIADTSSG